MAAPPATRRAGDASTLFGETLADPYRWLEDGAAPEVQAWMDAQDAHARAFLGALPGRTELEAELRALFYFDAVGCPVKRGERLFYTRKHRDREKSVVYVRDDAGERVLFDPNTMSDDGTVSLGVWVPSRDGALVAWARRANNADAATLYLRDVNSGRDLPADVIDGAKYAVPSWLPDGSGFYYTRLPTDPDIPIAELPGHAEIRFHAIGTDAATDRLIRPATGSAETFLHADVSRDGRWLVVYVQHGWRSTDVYLADREADDTVLRPLAVDRDATFEVSIWDGAAYALTNEGAPRYRVLRAPLDALPADPGGWSELIAEETATLEGARLAGGYLVCRYLRDAASELALFALDGKLVRRLPLPGLGTVAELEGEPDDGELFFSWSSFADPPRVYRVALPDGATETWASATIDADTGGVVCEQIACRSKDGTEIPIFLLRGTDTRADGERPTILYGYGGFNVSLTPAFAPHLLPWLRRGGVYAIANLRGGGEYGEAWHRAGMLEAKQNVFDDFLAAGEKLIDAGWTRPARLAIRGGSNGGLLVGAAMTQRPELFGAVICAVPLLDMLRYHLHGSGRTWIPEYGDPDDEQMFPVLRAYSPLQQIADGTDYPALLMLSADSDDRVDPMHARKFVAAIQHASSARPAMLRIERNAGHGGADLVRQQAEQAVNTYAFLLAELGVGESSD